MLTAATLQGRHLPPMIDVRAANDRDRPQVIALIEEVFGAGEARRAERRWEWQWHGDPRLDRPGYKGVVAEWKGRLIASLSCIPAGLYVHGEPVTAWWGVDNLMHWGLTRQALREERRSPASGGPRLAKGLALALLDHPAAGPIQLGKHVAGKMIAIGTREGIGFEPVPGSGRWTRRLSTVPRLRQVLGGPTGTLAGKLADLALPRMPQATPAASVLEGAFDVRFDRLWDQARREHAAITRRDAALLDWRYSRHPDTDYTALVLEEPGGVRAYAVFSRFLRDGRCRGKLVDLLTRAGDVEAAGALIASALRHMRRQGVERVEFYACGGGLAALLRRFGFRPTAKDYPVMQRGLPAAALYVTDGDGDGA